MKFSELSTLFGEDTARMICEELGGDTVYIPKVDAVPKNIRIKELWLLGCMTTHAIAERVGCSERWVRKVLGR